MYILQQQLIALVQHAGSESEVWLGDNASRVERFVLAGQHRLGSIQSADIVVVPDDMGSVIPIILPKILQLLFWVSRRR
ncbi:MAG: hypothetical protein GY779_06815 [Gammaproteobacteria bacterium]|nr:hypothetical protein [Gammaproteobacteria bacterium]